MNLQPALIQASAHTIHLYVYFLKHPDAQRQLTRCPAKNESVGLPARFAEQGNAHLMVLTSRSLFRPSVRYGKRATVARTFLILPP